MSWIDYSDIADLIEEALIKIIMKSIICYIEN